MKILNLYAGIGGNRKLWSDEHEVTAVEIEPKIAEVYQSLFPNDKVVVEDAHEYLLNHYKEFDFIWSSPPCQSHSSFRKNICVRFRGTPAVYPDMSLWQEIIFLQNYCNIPWVVENVNPYYDCIIDPSVKLDRHLFWSNFKIEQRIFKKDNIRKAQIPDLQDKYGFDLSEIKISNKRQILRNCVEPEIGLHIFKSLPLK